MENELNDIKDNKGMIGQNFQKICFETINNPKLLTNNTTTSNNKDNKEESKNTTNYKTNKVEYDHPPVTANNSMPKKKKEKNKIDKNNAIIIKKLENENAHLRKLLVTCKLKKGGADKSTEKMRKFYNYFEKKLSTLSANKNNTINSGNFSNMYTLNNNDISLNSNSNHFSNAKNSLTNNLLDSIIDKNSTNQKKSKNPKKNSESCSILLTDGNLGKNIKKRKYKEIRSNSKNNKILITEIKLNKTNTKIKKYNKSKMNSIYFHRNNIFSNGKDIFDINRNNDFNNVGTSNTYFDKKKHIDLNSNFNDKFNLKRNKNLAIKSSYHSLKIDGTIPMLIKSKADTNFINNNTNIVLHKGKKNNEKIKSFNKNLLSNIINHNSIKINNLFEKKRNLRINKKKYNNYHSISSVTEKKLNDSKFNSSVSFDIRKLHNDTNKNNNNKNILETYVKKSEKNTENKILKEKSDYFDKYKNKLKNFMSYSSKVKKIITKNLNKNLKNLNNNLNLRNDNNNKLINSNQKKNNIFFTINKTIIHNMNNTFNNTHNKHCLTNINNSNEDLNDEARISPINMLKNSIDNNSTNLYNGINLKKKLLARCKITNNYNLNNNKFSSVIKTNPNDKIKKIDNKRKIYINKNIL